MSRSSSKATFAGKSIYTERHNCRACGGVGFETILDLGLQYLPRWVNKRDPKLPQAPLELVRCPGCGLLQLRHETDPELLCREYWYRSGINQTMRDALADVVGDGLHYAREGVWLDIGANDGYLLSRVPAGFTRVACEPALNMQSLLEEHADTIIPDFFTGEGFLSQSEQADIITSCAMFYHLSNPDEFVAGIAASLKAGGIWINQLSDAPTMFRQNAFDSICHEHACYYSAHDLAKIYARHGLGILKVTHNDVNGGSIRVVATRAKDHGPLAFDGIPRAKKADAQEFANRVHRWKDLMHGVFDSKAMRGSEVWGLGASTKGAVMLQYLDLSDRIVAIADRNISKVGTFVAGPWIPVLGEAELRKAKPSFVLALIWAFEREVVQREAELLASGTTLLMPLPHIKFVT